MIISKLFAEGICKTHKNRKYNTLKIKRLIITYMVSVENRTDYNTYLQNVCNIFNSSTEVWFSRYRQNNGLASLSDEGGQIHAICYEFDYLSIFYGNFFVIVKDKYKIHHVWYLEYLAWTQVNFK